MTGQLPRPETGLRGPLEPIETTVVARAGYRRSVRTGRASALREPWDNSRVAPVGSDQHSALFLLGRDIDALEREAHTRFRGPAAAAMAGILTPKKGVNRGARIARCGRIYPAIGLVTGEIGMSPIRCKDRACPSCEDRKATRRAARLRDAVTHRQRQPDAGTLHFVTLTLPKPRYPAVGCRDAYSRLSDAFGSMVKANTATGREFHRVFAGGVRTFEVTWSAKGDVHGSHVVAYDGFHCHAHCLLEVRAGQSSADALRWLILQWCARTGADPAACSTSRINDGRVKQLCKYVVKPMIAALGNAPIFREVFQALHGRRAQAGFGRWRHWGQWVDDTPLGEPLAFGHVDMGGLMRQTIGDGRHDFDLRFTGHGPNGRVELELTGVHVWDAIQADPRTFPERWRERGSCLAPQVEDGAAESSDGIPSGPGDPETPKARQRGGPFTTVIELPIAACEVQQQCLRFGETCRNASDACFIEVRDAHASIHSPDDES